MATSAIGLASMFLPSAQLNKNANAATAQTASTSSSTSSSGTGLTSSTAGTTFLNLLVKELQNQDPDSPVDSTSMVGQMISLNQLDQLISINQALTGTSGSAISSGASGSGSSAQAIGATPATSSAAQMEQRAELLNSAQNAGAAQAVTQAAMDPTKTLDLSTLNIPNGGK
jgi:flagellar basal-body rod modification protein FlgD